MEQNERKSSGINIGSASIIMVFSVLCLTIFAVLTFLTANNEYKLAEKSALNMQTYYAADAGAVVTEGKIREVIDNNPNPSSAIEEIEALDIGVTGSIESDGCHFNYAEVMDDDQEIQVELLLQDGNLKILKWELVNVAEWSADGEVHLWDGEF